GAVHAVVRRARPRRLLPARDPRLLPHARLRAGCERLHEHPRRDEGHRHVDGAREARGRRAAAGARDVAHVPPDAGRRTRPHRTVHPGGVVGRRSAALAALALVVAGLAAPAAFAHAYLVGTFPSASGILSKPPPQVRLTFDEAVEPRFAHISV